MITQRLENASRQLVEHFESDAWQALVRLVDYVSTSRCAPSEIGTQQQFFEAICDFSHLLKIVKEEIDSPARPARMWIEHVVRLAERYRRLLGPDGGEVSGLDIAWEYWEKTQRRDMFQGYTSSDIVDTWLQHSDCKYDSPWEDSLDTLMEYIEDVSSRSVLTLPHKETVD